MIACALLRGSPELDPASFLTGEEAGLIGPRAVAKRRDDFLRGRWIAKKLLAKRFPNTALTEHVVLPDERGVPIAQDRDLRPRAVSLSLTHTTDYAAAALVDLPSRVGIDAERLLGDPRLVARDYFTETERALLQGRSAHGESLAATLLWSSKEAIVKALGEGLRVPLLSIQIRTVAAEPLQRWSRVEASTESGEHLRVWSWPEHDFVIAVALIVPESLGEGEEPCWVVEV